MCASITSIDVEISPHNTYTYTVGKNDHEGVRITAIRRKGGHLYEVHRGRHEPLLVPAYDVKKVR